MIRFDARTRAAAIALAVVAGFVDAIGYIALGGFFVSFMSGNSTRLSVGLVTGSPNAAVAAGLIGAFVSGVVLGSLVARAVAAARATAVLVLVSLLLGLAAAVSALGFSPLALIIVAIAMGAENTVFEREGQTAVGLTYMTGTLVRLGRHLTAAFTGGDAFAWIPDLLLWLGLLTGALAGAAVYPHLGLQALWIAAAAAAAVGLAVRRSAR